MHTSVPTDRKKIVLSVLNDRQPAVRGAQGDVNAQHHREGQQHQAGAGHAQYEVAFIDSPHLGMAGRRRGQAAVDRRRPRPGAAAAADIPWCCSRCRRSLPKMNSCGVRSVTSSRSSAPVSRSEVIAVAACAATSSRLSTPTGIRP